MQSFYSAKNKLLQTMWALAIHRPRNTSDGQDWDWIAAVGVMRQQCHLNQAARSGKWNQSMTENHSKFYEWSENKWSKCWTERLMGAFSTGDQRAWFIGSSKKILQNCSFAARVFGVSPWYSCCWILIFRSGVGNCSGRIRQRISISSISSNWTGWLSERSANGGKWTRPGQVKGFSLVAIPALKFVVS